MDIFCYFDKFKISLMQFKKERKKKEKEKKRKKEKKKKKGMNKMKEEVDRL